MWPLFILPRWNLPLFTDVRIRFVELVDNALHQRLFHMVRVCDSAFDEYRKAFPLMVLNRTLVGPRQVADYQLGPNSKVTVLFEDGELVEGFEQ